MYKSIIDIKKSVPQENLPELEAMANKAFDNRAGKVVNISPVPYVFAFEGDESKYASLSLGQLTFWKELVSKKITDYIGAWQWIDEEYPEESCDVLKAFSTPMR